MIDQSMPPAGDERASDAAPAAAAEASDRSVTDEDSDDERELSGSELGRQQYWVSLTAESADGIAC